MPEARVESIDALKSLKLAMIKFAEGANVALGDSESEVVRTINWLQNEQTSFWQMQHRKLTELVGRCKEQLRMKQIFKDSSGRQQSAVEEQKALKVAMRKLEEAEFKINAIKRAIKHLEKEFPMYKGAVQRFATDVVVSVPAAVSHLENLVLSLEAYTSLGTPVEVTSSAAPASSEASLTSEQVGSMARAVEDEKKKEADSAGSESDEPHHPDSEGSGIAS